MNYFFAVFYTIMLYYYFVILFTFVASQESHED